MITGPYVLSLTERGKGTEEERENRHRFLSSDFFLRWIEGEKKRAPGWKGERGRN